MSGIVIILKKSNGSLAGGGSRGGARWKDYLNIDFMEKRKIPETNGWGWDTTIDVDGRGSSPGNLTTSGAETSTTFVEVDSSTWSCCCLDGYWT